MNGESGQVRLEMLSPAEHFAPRKPTAPTVDIPGPFSNVGIHSQAVKSSGENVNFVALLQPAFSKDTLPPLKTTIVEQRPA